MKKNIVIASLLIASFICAMEYNEEPEKLPIYYHPYYNFLGGIAQKLHPFDTYKYAKVHAHLKKGLNLNDDQFYTPEYATDAELKKVMTQNYLDSLHATYFSGKVAEIVEVWPLGIVPSFITNRLLLTPMRYATDGTIKATELALSLDNHHRYAINLGGGFHHATGKDGGGFCIYPDIQLACKRAWELYPDLKILYVDLDAHQGNGVEITLEEEMDKRTFVVFDVYGQNNYPRDCASQRMRNKIQYGYPQTVHNLVETANPTDEKYLDILKKNLPNVIEEEKPGLIFYNAGTDVYEKDLLGGMSLTSNGIRSRDEFVFAQAKKHNIPIVMTLSGGYSPESASIIGKSIENIVNMMG